MGVPGTAMLEASEPRLHPAARDWLPWHCHGVTGEVGYPGGRGALGWGLGMGCSTEWGAGRWGTQGMGYSRDEVSLGIGCQRERGTLQE